MSILASGNLIWSTITLSRAIRCAKLRVPWLSIQHRAFTIPRKHFRSGVPITPLLESITDEYADAQISLLQAQPALVGGTEITRPCQVLVRLAAKGDFISAENVKIELEGMGIIIQRDEVYSEAALHALRTLRGDDRRKAFLSWWLLTPRSTWRIAFQRVQQLLLDDNPDLTLIMELCMRCASDGFSGQVGNSLLAHIVRYADVSVSTPFVLAFENAARDYPDVPVPVDIRNDTERPYAWMYRRILDSRVDEDRPQAWMHWRNLAIRTHCLAGRRSLASQLLYAARDDGIIIEPATYYILLQHLHHVDLPEHFEHVRRLQAADRAGDPSVATIEPQHLPPLPANMSRHNIHRRPTPAQLAASLRMLRTVTSTRHPAPYASALADFMFHYDRVSRRWRALLALRRRVFARASRSAAAQWVAGEQLFYLSQSRPLAALRTFMHHCEPRGVPADAARHVLALCDAPEHHARRRMARVDWQFARAPAPLRARLWPLPMNLALAWKALVQLATDRGALEGLYAHLLQQARGARDAAGAVRAAAVVHDVGGPTPVPTHEVGGALTLTRMDSSAFPPRPAHEDGSALSEQSQQDGGELRHTSEPLAVRQDADMPPAPAGEDTGAPPSAVAHEGPITPPPATPPDASFFHPFILAFGQRVGARRGALVLADMRRLGLRPQKDSWAALAACFARAGDAARVGTILWHVEDTYVLRGGGGGGKIGGGLARSEAELAGCALAEGPKERWRTRCMYNMVLRGFVECGLIPEARMVEQRMRAGGYLDGDVDRRTHGLLHRLSRAEKGKFDLTVLRRRRRTVVVDGKTIFADPEKVFWKEDGAEQVVRL